MLTTIKSAALSALIAIGGLSALPAAAQADNVYLGFGGHRGGAELGIQVGNDDWRGNNWRDDDWRDSDWREDGWRRDDRRWTGHYRGCSPDRALTKAWRVGVRNPRIVDIDRRTIEVRGHKRGHRVNILFGRAPHCPIIG